MASAKTPLPNPYYRLHGDILGPFVCRPKNRQISCPELRQCPAGVSAKRQQKLHQRAWAVWAGTTFWPTETGLSKFGAGGWFRARRPFCRTAVVLAKVSPTRTSAGGKQHLAVAPEPGRARRTTTGEFQVTVCGVTVCPFSRHKGNQRPKCL